MSALLRNLLLGLIGLIATLCAEAQTAAPARPAGDFSDDPCGSPLVESQLWYSVDGEVVSVEDGSTLLIALTKGHRRLRVHVVGIAVEQHGPLADQAKGHVTEMVLNKSVGVSVNTDWLYRKKKPAEITGVVQLLQGAEGDVGLSLLAKGLARAKEPQPYTMSNYTLCKYRQAQSGAESNRLGIWR